MLCVLKCGKVVEKHRVYTYIYIYTRIFTYFFVDIYIYTNALMYFYTTASVASVSLV